MKHLDSRGIAELAALNRRVRLTLQFMDEAEDLAAVSAQLSAVVESAFSSQDLKAMRLIARDIDGLTAALPRHQRDGLEALLRARLGIDKEAERADVNRELLAAIQRGEIRSEKERRRLEDQADLLEATGGDSATIEAVRRLLES